MEVNEQKSPWRPEEEKLLASLPISFSEIVEEIVQFSDIPREIVEHQVWMEALSLGWNVGEEVKRFQVSPHRFDEKMESLYRGGEGFIFETLVFWARPSRQKWTVQGLHRILSHARSSGAKPSDLRVLMLGDGAGNDSIFLAQTGINVDFFEVPFSRTYDFALKRFASRDLLGGRIRVLESYADCLSGQYDVVISFEVLEHLPDPPAAIRDLSVMLKEGGIALITEAFSYLADNFPTHLEANRQYAGRTPFLFLRNGMLLRWYSPDPLFKPMEFVKLQRPELKNFLGLVSDATVTRLWICERRCNFKRQAKSLFRG